MAYVKLTTLNRYATGWSDPMGSLAGAPNMITGRTEPMDEQSYDDWLMWILIKHGTDPFYEDIPYSKNNAAISIGHMEVSEEVAVNGRFERRLTPKAQRYLEIMNKENE